MARMGERRGSYRFLAVKPEVRRATGRAKHRWEDNIKTDLNEIVWEGPHWTDLPQNRDNWQIRILVPQNAGNLNGSATVSFLRISLLHESSY